MSTVHPVGVALENRLMSDGIYVTSVTWLTETGEDEDRRRPPDSVGLSVEYETVADVPAVTTREVSAVVRTLLSIAEEREWTPGRLEVIATNTDGDHRGRFHVEETWFEELGTTLSELEFSDRVLATRRRPE